MEILLEGGVYNIHQVDDFEYFVNFISTTYREEMALEMMTLYNDIHPSGIPLSDISFHNPHSLKGRNLCLHKNHYNSANYQ